jgi:hypothetical protein
VVAASASQSVPPPKPFFSVTVTELPPVTFVELTSNDGGELMANGNADDVPPPGWGVVTVTCAVPTAAISDGPMVA